MDRSDSRSGQRQKLRLDDRDEGTEFPAGSGLRLRRNVLRRPDLEARQLKEAPTTFSERPCMFPAGPFTFIRHSAGGVLNRKSAIADFNPIQDSSVIRRRFSFAAWLLACFILGGAPNAFAIPSPVEAHAPLSVDAMSGLTKLAQTQPAQAPATAPSPAQSAVDEPIGNVATLTGIAT